MLSHSAQWLWQSPSVGSSVPDYKQVERVFGRDVYTQMQLCLHFDCVKFERRLWFCRTPLKGSQPELLQYSSLLILFFKDLIFIILLFVLLTYRV